MNRVTNNRKLARVQIKSEDGKMLYDITNIDHSKKRIEVELPHGTLKVPAILTADDSRAYIEAELPTGIVKEKSKLSVELPFAANGNNEYPIKVYANGDDINPNTYTLGQNCSSATSAQH